jgi:hypothetical protein
MDRPCVAREFVNGEVGLALLLGWTAPLSPTATSEEDEVCSAGTPLARHSMTSGSVLCT